MIKKDFVEILRKKGFTSKKKATKSLNIIIEAIKETLIEKKQDIIFVGLGKFEVADVAEREHRNPKTGEKIMIPAHKAIKFKASKSLNKKVR